MNEEYDVIILGTGLKECILSGLLSVAGKKVLHMDRNNYYGGDAASLSMENLYQKFEAKSADEKVEVPKALGRSRDYNVDQCPKFIMACGNLVKVLLHTKVTRYLDFKKLGGSYVYVDGAINKVPATATEALSTNLLSFFQKRRYRNFLQWVASYELNDEKTHEGFDCSRVPMKTIYEYWKLDATTIDFTGHAIALHLDDSYLDKPAIDTIEKLKLYMYSLSRYGDSPYIYPVYGLGGLPEGFSRLSAIYGGTYMLNKPIDEILYDTDGNVIGVKSEGEVARCKQLLADPSYFVGTDKIVKLGQIARWIFILSHAIQGIASDSGQVIFPQKQLNRGSDMYLSFLGRGHMVTPEGKFVAMVNALVETNNPKQELMPAAKLIGQFDKDFFSVCDIYAANPAPGAVPANCFITTSYDATTHFETATDEVLAIYERMTGQKVDLTISADPEDIQNTQE